jgi:hypothetical protein
LTERKAVVAVIGECAADGYYRRRCCRTPNGRRTVAPAEPMAIGTLYA